MFYKTTSFKMLFFLQLKIRSFTVKSVFSQVHHQCKLYGENFYITLVNVVHSYNTIYLVVILGKTVGGAFSPTLPYRVIVTFTCTDLARCFLLVVLFREQLFSFRVNEFKLSNLCLYLYWSSIKKRSEWLSLSQEVNCRFCFKACDCLFYWYHTSCAP